MDGIEKKMELQDPIEEDIYEMNPAERRRTALRICRGIFTPPFWKRRKSKLVREVLGDHIFNKFIENKKIEWDTYRTHVSQFEIDRYLPSCKNLNEMRRVVMKRCNRRFGIVMALTLLVALWGVSSPMEAQGQIKQLTSVSALMRTP